MEKSEMTIDGVDLIPENHREKIDFHKCFSKLQMLYNSQFGYDWRSKHNDLLEKYEWMMRDDPG